MNGAVPVRSRFVAAWPLLIVVAALAAYSLRVRHEMVDFAVYRTSAERALEAAPLYRADDGHYQFKYLPAFALALAPAALVPEPVARAGWFALSVALLVLFVRFSIRALPAPRLPAHVLVLWVVVLMAKFYAHELNLGQSNVLLGALAMGALVAVQRGQGVLAGALAAAAVFVKPYALILMPWLYCSAGPRTMVAAGGVLGVGLLVPVVVYGWQGNLDLLAAWWRTVTDSTAPNLLGADNVSLAATWAKWLGPGALASALAAASALALLGVVGLMMRWRRRAQEPAYLECAALLLLVPLVSPQGWDYVLLLGTPAVACLVDRFTGVKAGGPSVPLMPLAWRVVTALALGVMSFTLFDVLGRELYAQAMAVNIVAVAAIVLVLCLAEVRRRGVA